MQTEFFFNETYQNCVHRRLSLVITPSVNEVLKYVRFVFVPTFTKKTSEIGVHFVVQDISNCLTERETNLLE